MKAFVYKISKFSVALVMVWILLYLTSNYWLNKNKYYKIPVDKSHIIMGHSQSACAYNDSMLPGFLNISESMEGYFYSYFKLKKLLSSNNQIKTIFLEYTNNQVSEFANDRIYGKYLVHILPEKASIVDKRSLVFLFKKNPNAFLRSINPTIKNNISFILSGAQNYVKSKWIANMTPDHIFEGKKKEKTEKTYASQTGIIKKNYNVSQSNLWYLAKIAQLCKTKKVQLVFVRSPLNSDFTIKNEATYQEILKDEFSDIPFLDFNNFKMETKEFADYIHMNKSGEKRYTLFFKKMVDSGILNEENQQIKIDSAIENYSLMK